MGSPWSVCQKTKTLALERIRLTKRFVNENPSSASEVTFDTGFNGIGVKTPYDRLATPDEVERDLRDAAEYWD